MKQIGDRNKQGKPIDIVYHMMKESGIAYCGRKDPMAGIWKLSEKNLVSCKNCLKKIEAKVNIKEWQDRLNDKGFPNGSRFIITKGELKALIKNGGTIK